MLSYHGIGKFKGKQVKNLNYINNLREAKEIVAFFTPILLTCSVGDRVTLEVTLHSEVCRFGSPFWGLGSSSPGIL